MLSEVFVSGETGLTKLPANLPIYLRGAVDWAKVFKNVEDLVHQRAARAQNGAAVAVENDPTQQAREYLKKNADIDLDSELLGNLEPGFALAAGISPTASISTALQFNPARQNPFENYTVAIIARVKDPAKAKATLEKVAKLGSAIGAELHSREVAGGTVYTVTYAKGEGMSWTLRGNDIILAGGYGEKLGELITSVSKGTGSVKPEQFPAKTRELLFGNQGVAAALDMKKIDEAIRNLQSDAGPGSEMMRSAFTSVLSQVSALRPAVAVVPTQGGVLVDAALSL